MLFDLFRKAKSVKEHEKDLSEMDDSISARFSEGNIRAQQGLVITDEDQEEIVDQALKSDI